MKCPVLALLFGGAVAIAGCSHKDEGAGSSKSKKTAPTADATQDATAEAAADADIPTEEDMEEAAEKTVTSANVEDEVAKLEKEIGN